MCIRRQKTARGAGFAANKLLLTAAWTKIIPGKESLMSQKYDFKSFIDSIEDMSYLEIIAATDKHIEMLERLPKKERNIAYGYSRRVGRFLFFMRQGMRPTGVTQYELSLYKQVCERLIEKGEMNKGILSTLE